MISYLCTSISSCSTINTGIAVLLASTTRLSFIAGLIHLSELLAFLSCGRCCGRCCNCWCRLCSDKWCSSRWRSSWSRSLASNGMMSTLSARKVEGGLRPLVDIFGGSRLDAFDNFYLIFGLESRCWALSLVASWDRWARHLKSKSAIAQKSFSKPSWAHFPHAPAPSTLCTSAHR